MAKELKKPQPTSSVINMLDPAVAAAATMPPESVKIAAPTPLATQLPITSPQPLSEKPPEDRANVLRQYTLTASTEKILKELVDLYSDATNLSLKSSEVLRAILVALKHATPELAREAVHIGPLKRPKHERGNEGLRDNLERKIARAIVAGMRAANTME